MLKNGCLSLVFIAFCTACSNSPGQLELTKLPPVMVEGSQDWLVWVDKQVVSSDSVGHGPDLGSAEWCQVVEIKLFKNASGLTPCSKDWNAKVTQQLRRNN